MSTGIFYLRSFSSVVLIFPGTWVLQALDRGAPFPAVPALRGRALGHLPLGGLGSRVNSHCQGGLEVAKSFPACPGWPESPGGTMNCSSSARGTQVQHCFGHLLAAPCFEGSGSPLLPTPHFLLVVGPLSSVHTTSHIFPL